MKIPNILKKEVEKIRPEKEILESINQEAKGFCKNLEKKLKARKINAEVFIGGSLAKQTLIKKKKYDADIFVRFNEAYRGKDISKILERVLRKGKNIKKIHGSRDYYQINKGILLEIVPVLKVSKPEKAENVTDLSYFHVNYIKNQIKRKKKLPEEIMLAKSFCHAQNCYGAESYIHGFSGYALELLISYYGSFFNFIKAITKVKQEKQIILDPSRFYKNKQEILLELNESKLQSPIVFVDPTFKERNALAALSKKTFEKFKEMCKKFLKNPNNKFFEKQDLKEKLKKKHKNLTIIQTKTNRQKGDIAGSKLRKFHDFMLHNLKRYFEIQKEEFEYDEGDNLGKSFLVLKQKEQIIIEGPPITSVENLTRFKKKHKNSFIKNKKAYAKINPPSFRNFFSSFKKSEKRVMKEMGITKIECIS